MAFLLLLIVSLLTATLGLLHPMQAAAANCDGGDCAHFVDAAHIQQFTASGGHNYWTLGQSFNYKGQVGYYYYSNYRVDDGTNNYAQCLDNFTKKNYKVPSYNCDRIVIYKSQLPIGLRQVVSGDPGDTGTYGSDFPLTLEKTNIFNEAQANAALKKYGVGKIPLGPGDNSDQTATPTPIEDKDTPTCDQGSGFSLNWLFCSIYDGLSQASGWVLNKLIMPELRTSPLCVSGGTSSSDCRKDPIYAIWSNFRIYGDIFLVIALLVVVFGQAIGGGVVDAYTAKKVLPRLLGAAILINLSIYIVAGLLDITNIIGGGLGELITAPLKGAGVFKINPSGVSQVELTGALGAGAVLGGAGAIAGIFSVAGASMILDVILVPVFLVFIAIIATIAIRKAIIIALVFTSPVAFALYCLPNTERYFKKWWDLLLEMLAVYPIIILLFAISDVLSVTVSSTAATTDKVTAGINTLLSFIFLVIPLFLIPFAFKIAGGTIGRIHDAVGGAREKAHAMGAGRRERSMANFKDKNLQVRQDRYSKLQDSASKGGKFRRATLGRGLSLAARGYGGYNIEAETSAARAAKGKALNDQIATGDDKEIRALTVNKAWADRNGVEGVDWRTEDGKRQYKTLGGAWADEASVIRAQKRWGGDTFAQQTALSYEMRKASSNEEVQHVANNFARVAGKGAGGWGMTEQQAGGAWIGAAFEHQNDHLEYKYTNWKDGSMSADKAQGFAKEMYEKRGSYNLSQMGANTIEMATAAYDAAEAAGDTQTMDQLRAVSEVFMHQMGSQVGAQDDGTPIAAAPVDLQTGQPARDPRTGELRRMVSTQGSAHLSESVYRFADRTGRRTQAPDPTHTQSPDSPQS